MKLVLEPTMFAQLDFNTWAIIGPALVIVLASLLLFTEWYRADREVKLIRRRVAELERLVAQPLTPIRPMAAT